MFNNKIHIFLYIEKRENLYYLIQALQEEDNYTIFLKDLYVDKYLIVSLPFETYKTLKSPNSGELIDIKPLEVFIREFKLRELSFFGRKIISNYYSKKLKKHKDNVHCTSDYDYSPALLLAPHEKTDADVFLREIHAFQNWQNDYYRALELEVLKYLINKEYKTPVLEKLAAQANMNMDTFTVKILNKSSEENNWILNARMELTNLYNKIQVTALEDLYDLSVFQEIQKISNY